MPVPMNISFIILIVGVVIAIAIFFSKKTKRKITTRDGDLDKVAGPNLQSDLF